MKRAFYLLLVLGTIIYSFYYASLGGFVGNEGALSKIGLTHHVLFSIWGALTYITLSIGIIIGYKKTKYSFYKHLLIISLVGMVLTLCFDFLYDDKLNYWMHCIGSLTFSAVTGLNVFLLFILSKKKLLSIICGGILLIDFILLLIFKETAIIELFPIISGLIMLTINAMVKERTKIEANGQTK